MAFLTLNPATAAGPNRVEFDHQGTRWESGAVFLARDLQTNVALPWNIPLNDPTCIASNERCFDFSSVVNSLAEAVFTAVSSVAPGSSTPSNTISVPATGPSGVFLIPNVTRTNPSGTHMIHGFGIIVQLPLRVVSTVAPTPVAVTSEYTLSIPLSILFDFPGPGEFIPVIDPFDFNSAPGTPMAPDNLSRISLRFDSISGGELIEEFTRNTIQSAVTTALTGIVTSLATTPPNNRLAMALLGGALNAFRQRNGRGLLEPTTNFFIIPTGAAPQLTSNRVGGTARGEPTSFTLIMLD